MIIEQSTVVLDGNMFTGSSVGVGGEMNADDSKMTFSRQNSFLNNTAWFNKGGAIFLLDSVSNITGIQNFILNSAPNGGVMAIGGTSKLILDDDVKLNFVKNKTLHHGGTLVFETYIIGALLQVLAISQIVSLNLTQCLTSASISAIIQREYLDQYFLEGILMHASSGNIELITGMEVAIVSNS